MINPFEFIRENVNIIEAAEKYGIEINHNNKALCIFHDDSHPSMSFKNNRFKCFSCGASGSVIDLVMRVCNLTSIEAVKQISEDFNLGSSLKIDFTVDKSEIREYNQNRVILSGFEKWCDATYSMYAMLAKFYSENAKKYKPMPGEKDFHPRYVEALHRLEPVINILDVLLKGSDHEKIKLYKDLTS